MKISIKTALVSRLYVLMTMVTLIPVLFTLILFICLFFIFLFFYIFIRFHLSLPFLYFILFSSHSWSSNTWILENKNIINNQVVTLSRFILIVTVLYYDMLYKLLRFLPICKDIFKCYIRGYTSLFTSNTFISNSRLLRAKNLANAK